MGYNAFFVGEISGDNRGFSFEENVLLKQGAGSPYLNVLSLGFFGTIFYYVIWSGYAVPIS